MKRMIATAVVVLCGIHGALAQGSQGNPEEGAQKAYTCTGCHGIPAYFNVYPMYHVPKIGGQNYDYLVAALQAYRAGDREHATMRAQAGTLSDKDIVDIASYFVSLTPQDKSEGSTTVDNPSGVPQDKLQICAGCHGLDGIGVNPTYPKLAGQYADYMLQALRAYKDGSRNNAVMAAIMPTLSEQDMKDLSVYYSKRDGLIDLKID